MPLMEWCSECTSSQNPAVNCMDPLGSISSICLDHYMEDCRPWYDMCRQQPAGLEAICGTNGDFQMGACASWRGRDTVWEWLKKVMCGVLFSLFI